MVSLVSCSGASLGPANSKLRRRLVGGSAILLGKPTLISEMRDRRQREPDVALPFEHDHEGTWVVMTMVHTGEVEREAWIRHEATFSCPRCGYELTESTPLRPAAWKPA